MQDAGASCVGCDCCHEWFKNLKCCKCIRESCCYKTIFESRLWKMKAILLFFILVPWDIYTDILAASRYSERRHNFYTRYNSMQSDISEKSSNVAASRSPYDETSDYGVDMIAKYKALSDGEKHNYCDVDALFDQVNGNISHTILDEMKMVEGFVWFFVALSIVVVILYIFVNFVTGMYGWLCKGQFKDGAVARLHQEAQYPWLFGFFAMLIQFAEDCPQVCLLVFMVISIFKSDGSQCMKKLNDWGENPSLWSAGGADALKPAFNYARTDFLMFFTDQAEVARSFATSCCVILLTYVMTMFKVRWTVHESITGGSRIGEYWMVSSVFVFIVTPILACFYFGGVHFLDQENTEGGFVMLVSFAIFAGFALCTCLCWGSFCYSKHRTYVIHMKKVKEEERQNTLNMNSVLELETGISVKDKVIIPSNAANTEDSVDSQLTE